MPGVVAFLSAKDIPGENNFMKQNNYRGVEEVSKLMYYINQFPKTVCFSILLWYYVDEYGYIYTQVFCSGQVLYHGQAIGIIVAGKKSLY